MKHLIMLMLLFVVSMSVHAQHVTANFKKVSMSEALLEVERQCKDCRINFIYDELQDFTITQNIKGRPVLEALRLIAGYYPIRITHQGNIYSVECVQKESAKVTGRILDEKGKPFPYVNVTLLSLTDSSYINSGVSNNNGDVVIPCARKNILARISYVGYKTVYRQCTNGSLGNIRMSEAMIALNQVKVEGEKTIQKTNTQSSTSERQKLTRCQVLKPVHGSNDIILEHMRYLLKDDPDKMQESITCIDAIGQEHIFTPDSLLGFYVNGIPYLSLTYTYEGQTRKGFLERCMDDNESKLKFFAHYDEFENVTYYVQKDFETTVCPADDDQDNGYVSPLHMFLTSLAGDKAIFFEPYIECKDMSPEKFMEMKRIVKTGNIGKFSRVKYGVTLSIENTTINCSDYTFEPVTKVAAGVFADIPLFAGISLHPELTVSKYGHRGMHVYYQELSSAAYNATAISMPLMMRYSYIFLPGKFTPYVQLGYQPTILASGKMEYRYIAPLQSSPYLPLDYNFYLKLVEGEKNVHKYFGNFIVGIGMEYLFTPKHSLFFDIRCRFLPTKHGNSCVMANISFSI